MVVCNMDKATVGSSVSTCIGDEKRCKRIQLWKVQLSFYIISNSFFTMLLNLDICLIELF